MELIKLTRFDKRSETSTVSYFDQRNISALSASLIVILVLSCIKLTHIPEFVRDSQYYIQSALLWPLGKVSFAGSLISDRHLTVWYYHFFLKTFGYSLDSLSIALTTLFALNCLCILGMSLLILKQPLLIFIVSAALNLISFCTSIWNFSSTEATFTLANSFILFIWIIAFLNSNQISTFLNLLFYCSIAVGLLSNFRAGNLLFIVGIITTILFFQKKIIIEQIGVKQLRKGYKWISIVSITILLAFKLGSLCSTASWRLWVPVDKPPTYFYAFIFFHPIYSYARGSNGLFSKNILQEMSLNSSEKIDFWKTLGFTFTKYGTKSSDTVMRNLGLEAAKSYPLEILRDTAISIKYYLKEPPFEFKLLNQSYTQQGKRSKEALQEYDKVRRETSQQFGGDAYISTAFLTSYKSPLVNYLRQIIPSFKINIKIPGVLFLLMLFLMLTLLINKNNFLLILFLPFSIFTWGTFLIAAFSQGFVYRYAEPFLLQSMFIVCVSSLGLYKRSLFLRKSLCQKR